VRAWIGSLLSLQGILTDPAFETLWSLSYEVWFYILTCGVGIIIMKRKEGNVLKYNTGIALFLLSLLAFIKLSVTYLFVWIIGAIALWREPKPNRTVLLTMAIISFSIMILLQLGSGSHFIANSVVSDDALRKFLIVLFGFSFAKFIQHVIQIAPSSVTVRGGILLVINGLGSRLAAFSYTLYLTHVPVLKLLIGLGAPKSTSLSASSIGLYFLWLTIAMAVAYALYYLFERNTSKVKKFFKLRLNVDTE